MPYIPEPNSPAEVGERLRITREALGMSLSQLASLMGGGMYASKWSNAEQGLNYPQPQDLSRFYQVTGANADWIMRGIMAHLPASLIQLISAHQNGGAGHSRSRRPA